MSSDDPRPAVDPTQLAMHGLLRAYFDDLAAEGGPQAARERRASAILERVAAVRRGTQNARESEPAVAASPAQPLAGARGSEQSLADARGSEGFPLADGSDSEGRPPQGRGSEETLLAAARGSEQSLADARGSEYSLADGGGADRQRPQGRLSPHTLAGGRILPSRIRRAAFRRARRWLTGCAATAAAVSLAALIFFSINRTASVARAEPLQRAAVQLVSLFLPADDPVLLFDADAARQRAADVEAALMERDRLRAGMVEFAGDPPDAGSQNACADLMIAWQRAYYGMRALGRWDDALEQIDAALEYCRANPTGREWPDWAAVCLYDLGNTLAAAGDLAGARAAFLESLDVRRRWLVDTSTPERMVLSRAFQLAPVYWSLSTLALLRHDLADARYWQQQSDAAFRAYLYAGCVANGAAVAAGAPLTELYAALPVVLREPPELITEAESDAAAAGLGGFGPKPSIIAHLRDHLWREARLLRLEGKLGEAAAMLASAEALPWYKLHAESRQDFLIPLEAARLAIARRDYRAALARLVEAERNTGPLSLADRSGADVSSPPIDALGRAELDLLRGVALLGVNPKDQTAVGLIRRAVGLPRRLAAQLDEADRPAFMRQFAAWEELEAVLPR